MPANGNNGSDYMTVDIISKNFEERMFTAWLIHDSSKCVKCRYQIKQYYKYHYKIVEAWIYD